MRAGGDSMDVARLPAAELRRLIGDRELSCVEVTEACLAQIERHNGVINAAVTLNDDAVNEARLLDQRLAAGDSGGVLAGIPVGIKDVTHTAGMRTTYGSPLYADHVPDVDALVCSAAQGRRCDHSLQDQHSRVCHRRQHLQRGFRRDAQPVEHRSERRWFDRWGSPPAWPRE